MSTQDSEPPVDLDNYQEEESEPKAEETKESDPNVSSYADGKVVKKIIRAGEGRCPEHGNQVQVHYVGRLEDGTEFDSSRKRNEPFQFELGKREVIHGWEVAVSKMKKGELAEVKIHPDFGYGDKGTGSIPPKATLIFEIELLSWTTFQNVTMDGRVRKEILINSEDYNRPSDLTKCFVNYKGKVVGSDRYFVEGNDVLLHMGEDYSIPRGLEDVFLSMNPGEKSIVRLAPEYAYGEAGDAKLGIPPNAELEYEIHLLRTEKYKETWEMNTNERIQLLHKKKNQGNDYFKMGRMHEAIRKYDLAIGMTRFDEESRWTPEQKQAIKEGCILCNNNIAQCQLKLKDYPAVLKATTEVLKEDRNNVKALFRRAQALFACGEAYPAYESISAAKKLEPNNPSIKEVYQQIHAVIKVDTDKEKRMFGGFFNKVQLFSAGQPEPQPASATAPVQTTADELPPLVESILPQDNPVVFVPPPMETEPAPVETASEPSSQPFDAPSLTSSSAPVPLHIGLAAELNAAQNADSAKQAVSDTETKATATEHVAPKEQAAVKKEEPTSSKPSAPSVAQEQPKQAEKSSPEPQAVQQEIASDNSEAKSESPKKGKAQQKKDQKKQQAQQKKEQPQQTKEQPQPKKEQSQPPPKATNSDSAPAAAKPEKVEPQQQQKAQPASASPAPPVVAAAAQPEQKYPDKQSVQQPKKEDAPPSQQAKAKPQSAAQPQNQQKPNNNAQPAAKAPEQKKPASASPQKGAPAANASRPQSNNKSQAKKGKGKK